MAIQKYLEKYAEPEASLCKDISNCYTHVLCIPAFAETPDFLAATTAAITQQKVLVILVVNAPASANSTQLEQTRAMAAHLKQQHPTRQQLADNMCLLDAAGADILLVERCSPGLFLAEKDGVGRARKIACDITCRLIADGTVASPWIHCTDADCTLPADYFQAVQGLNATHTSAAIYPFRHTPHADDQVRLAQQLYDAALDYYVDGLAWAGSPWAFHTIGSTLTVSAAHYAKVRGFPVRAAGEDFYLLNKLAKTGRVAQLECSPLLLASRLSDRVPFGTGPALQKILAMDNPVENYRYYHPLCFQYLKCWLTLAQTLWQKRITRIDTACIRNFCQDDQTFADVNSDIMQECLLAFDIRKGLTHAFAHSNSEAVFARHLRNWFDAFMTLKCIHWLRDNHFTSVPLSTFQDETGLPFAPKPRG